MFLRKINNTLWASASLLMLASSALFSCQSDEKDDPEPKEDSVLYAYDVYVTAYYDSTSASGARSSINAGYFVNGNFVPLAGPDDNNNAYAYDICVENGNVYVAGMENYNAVYWVNGEINYLPSGTVAQSIAVKNGNIYICGHEATITGDVACCWINNTKYELEGGSSAVDIAVDNSGHVYIVGNEYNYTTSKYSLRYWTNAETTNFEKISRYSITTQNSCQGKCIAIDETHIKTVGNIDRPFMCIGGFESLPSSGNLNKHWIERKETSIASPSSGNEVYSISACNGKVYSCGNDRTYAKYWMAEIGSKGENNNLKSVSLSDGKKQWYAVGIHAVNDNAFVVGYEEALSVHHPVVWQNGELLMDCVSQYNAIPTALYVSARPISPTQVVEGDQ